MHWPFQTGRFQDSRNVELTLICSTRDAIYSRGIRHLDWSRFSHVAITDGTWVWESTRRHGVRKTPLAEYRAPHQYLEYLPVVGRENQLVINRLVMRERQHRIYPIVHAIKTLLRIDYEVGEDLLCSVFIAWALDYDNTRFPGQLLNRVSPEKLYDCEMIRVQESGLFG